MKFFIFLLAACVFVTSPAFSDSIAFHHSNWQAVKDLAKEQNKYILMYGYFDGCAPCVEMKKNVFTNDTVAAYYNDHFICYALNIHADDESKALAKEYEMRGFPTFIFFNSKGELVHRGEGGKSSLEFMELAKNALNPDRSYIALKQRYESGERTPALLYQYSKTLMDFDGSDATQTVIDEYIASQTKEVLLEPENLEYLMEAGSDVYSFAGQHILDHYETYLPHFGEEKMQDKVKWMATASARKAAQSEDASMLSTTKKAIITSQIPEGDRLCALVDVEYALAENPRDYIKCTQAALAYGEKYASSDTRPLSTIALYTVMLSPDNLQHLEAAEKVILMALDYQKNYQNMYIYAQILEKLRKKEEAVAVAQKAITLAQEEGADYAQMRKLVERVSEKNN